VIRAELARPPLPQASAQLQRGFSEAELPLVADPVDEQLTDLVIRALIGVGRDEMWPDQLVGRPVGRIIDLALPRPGRDQDLMDLMPGLALPRLSHLGADDGLDEPVNLQRVVCLVDFRQR
jgi:hypothetical protein